MANNQQDEATELASLRAELTSGKRGKRYSESIKERVRAWALHAQSSGMGWEKASRALGIHVDTLRAWCGAQRVSTTKRPRMRAVEIADIVSETKVSIATPSGYRVEGLTLAQAVTMLRALG